MIICIFENNVTVRFLAGFMLCLLLYFNLLRHIVSKETNNIEAFNVMCNTSNFC